MEFFIGFIMGLILAHVATFVMYKDSLGKIQSEYEHKINEVMEMLNEYNR